MSGKISSDVVSAQDAISELVGVDTSGYSNETVTLGGSNIKSMTTGMRTTNQVLKDVSKLASCVLSQAKKFPALAQVIEQRDKEDAMGICLAPEVANGQ